MVATQGELVAKPAIDGSLFDKLNPSRLDNIFLYYEDVPRDYRYKLTVVDRKLPPSSRLNSVTAVVLIPAGRESEYVFSSQRGLLSVAESANCGRLIAVAFGRHHTFESQTAVQEELTFVAQVLSKQGLFLPPALYKRHTSNLSIPFLALDGIGSRNVLAEGDTTLSGRYLVEQVRGEGRIVRRLYFMDNPLVIQSEVALLGDAVDKSFLAFDYHKHMSAGALALSDGSESLSGLVVGLGGGGLPNFLQHVLPSLTLSVVELDESVVTIAEKYFGFEQTSEGTVRIGDGLTIDTESEQEANDRIVYPPAFLDFIAIDVDSKDKTVGMSCPPAAFVEQTYLTKLKSILRPDGVLVINVSARDPAMFNMVKSNIKTVFQSCFVSDRNDEEDRDDVNVIVYARAGLSALPPKLKLIEAMNKNLQPFTDSNPASESWQSTLSELEDCVAELKVANDEHGTPSAAKKKNTGSKKGKKKKGKRR